MVSDGSDGGSSTLPTCFAPAELKAQLHDALLEVIRENPGLLSLESTTDGKSTDWPASMWCMPGKACWDWVQLVGQRIRREFVRSRRLESREFVRGGWRSFSVASLYRGETQDGVIVPVVAGHGTVRPGEGSVQEATPHGWRIFSHCRRFVTRHLSPSNCRGRRAERSAYTMVGLNLPTVEVGGEANGGAVPKGEGLPTPTGAITDKPPSSKPPFL